MFQTENYWDLGFGALTYKILDGNGTQLRAATVVSTPDEGGNSQGKLTIHIYFSTEVDTSTVKLGQNFYVRAKGDQNAGDSIAWNPFKMILIVCLLP